MQRELKRWERRLGTLLPRLPCFTKPAGKRPIISADDICLKYCSFLLAPCWKYYQQYGRPNCLEGCDFVVAAIHMPYIWFIVKQQHRCPDDGCILHASCSIL